jgi:hypothetical protein
MFMIAVGVDTHKEKHLAVAVNDLGQLLAEITITADLAGYRSMAIWLDELDGGGGGRYRGRRQLRCWALRVAAS